MMIYNRGPDIYNIDIIVSEIKNALCRKELTIGSYNKKLEEEFAFLHNCRYGVTCSSGGDALEIILRGLRINGSNQRAFIPVNSYPATFYAAFNAGYSVYFVDIKDDLMIDIDSIPDISSGDVVIVVSIGGWFPDNIESIVDKVARAGGFLVMDSAHAHFSKINNRSLFGIASGFSLYTTRLVFAGEGGIILTDNRDFYRSLISIRDCGIVTKKYDYYDYPGMSSRMSNIMAIIAYYQLKEASKIINSRKSAFNIYMNRLNKNKYFKFLFKNNQDWNYYKAIIIFDDVNIRNKFENYMLSNYIEMSSKVFPNLLNSYPFLKNNSVTIQDKNGKKILPRHACLPLYTGITEDDVDYICSVIERFKG